MGHAIDFPRPHPFLAAIIANFVSPLSLHVDASSIQRSLFEDYVCCTSVLLEALCGLQLKL